MLLLSVELAQGEAGTVDATLKSASTLVHSLYGEESELELQLWQVAISLSGQQVGTLAQRVQELQQQASRQQADAEAVRRAGYEIQRYSQQVKRMISTATGTMEKRARLAKGIYGEDHV